MSEVDGRNRRPALGRGLAALIPQAPPSNAGLMMLAIERITPDPQQPRQTFDEVALEELAQSIREQGVLQPVLVRREGQNFVLVAGERRWRAAQRAGLHEVPALVKDLTLSESFAVALVENLQRTDLTALEEAEGYRRLLEDHGLTQEDLAKQLGRDRSTIANTLRLLKLPPDVRALVARGSLSMGHARALLAAPTGAAQSALALEVVARQWSVRQTEARVRKPAASTASAAVSEDPNQRQLRETLQRALGLRITLHRQAKGGSLEIHYSGLDQLDSLVERLLR